MFYKTIYHLQTLPIASRAQSPRDDEEQSPMAEYCVDIFGYKIQTSVNGNSVLFIESYLIHLNRS